MKQNKSYLSSIVIVLIAIMFANCKKSTPYDTITAPLQATFLNQTLRNYSITTANSVDSIPVGITVPSNVDRTINIAVTSPTGAVSGTQYTVTSTTVAIPAGKTIGYFVVKGIYNQYLTGRKDTLVLNIQPSEAPGVGPSDYNSTLKVVLRGPCFEGDVNLNAFKGSYKAVETFGSGSPYGPYATTISAVNQLTATTGTITVTNIWDNGWSPITFTLDWTDPANRTVTVVSQTAIGGSNAGDLNSAYAGQTVAVRPFSGNPGTFSACNNTFTLKMQLGVTGVGFFGSLYTVNLTK